MKNFNSEAVTLNTNTYMENINGKIEHVYANVNKKKEIKNFDLEKHELTVKPQISNVEDIDKLDDFLREKNKIFLFINKISGSQEGKKIISLSENLDKNFTLTLEEEKIINIKYAGLYIIKLINNKISSNSNSSISGDVFVIVVDVLDSLKNSLGIKRLSLESQQSNKTVVLIGGGDGTILQVIDSFADNKVNIKNCLFGHLPIGTGNDLSNCLGFRNSINVPSCLASFQELIFKYYNSNETTIDIWEIKLKLENSQGDIIKTNNQLKKSSFTLKDKKQNAIFKKTFVIYFSIGFDGRIGFNFDKRRSSSRFWNKCIYYWEGFKKQFCQNTVSINNILSKFEEIQIQENNNNDNDDNNNNNNKNYFGDNIKSNEIRNDDVDLTFNSEGNNIKKTIICYGKNEELDNLKRNGLQEKSDLCLKPNMISLTCQNINLYMGGIKDVWKKAGTNYAINSTSDISIKEKVQSWETQSYNDQKLEFFSYGSRSDYVSDRLLGTGKAKKVYQGKGPFLFTFNDMKHVPHDDKVNRIYFNIDGEYFKLFNPKELIIRPKKSFNGGTIRILKAN